MLVFHNKIRTLDDVAAEELNVVRRVWVAMHDVDDAVRELAVDLWNKLRYVTTPTLCTELLVSIYLVIYYSPITRMRLKRYNKFA